ncbi:glycosyltransferase family 4 protein [Chloroflexota bacterium]
MKHEVLKEKTLALFFTCGVSLKTWHDVGMIDREVAVYNRLSEYFKRIYFFTYGDEGDLEYGSFLADNITVIPKKIFKNDLLYSVKLPGIHYNILRRADILKTNQMYGAWSAALARLLWRKKLVVRSGYTWSIFFRNEFPGSLKQPFVNGVERFAYRLADAAVNSSRGDYDYVEERYHPRRHWLIPNYVDTDVFKPLGGDKKTGSICCIGRLTAVKNLASLLEALRGLPYNVDIIGSGDQEAELKRLAADNNVKASFPGNIPNRDLPGIISEHALYVLPSLWEGMPKTLLEAMACGAAVLGANVAGIREVIKDGENGLLCGTDPSSIRKAVIRVMEDEPLRKKLGGNARKTIEEGYSLTKVVEQELELYEELLG